MHKSNPLFRATTHCAVLGIVLLPVGLLAQVDSRDIKPQVLQVPNASFEMPGSPAGATFVRGLVGLLPKTLSVLNSIGIDKTITNQLTDRSDQIVRDLEFADPGGVLIIARVQSRRHEAGKYSQLVGNKIDYIGIGKSSADAYLSHITRNTVMSDINEGDGWRLDRDMSAAFWVTRSANGFSMNVSSIDGLQRQAMAEYSRRMLDQYDWSAARANELDRLLNMAVPQLDVTARSQLMALARSRQDALANLKTTNAKLQRELRRADKAATNLVVVRTLLGAVDFATRSGEASKGLDEKDSARLARSENDNQLMQSLIDIGKEADRDASTLKQELFRENVILDGYEKTTIQYMRTRKIPTDNIPSGAPPLLLR